MSTVVGTHIKGFGQRVCADVSADSKWANALTTPVRYSKNGPKGSPKVVETGNPSTASYIGYEDKWQPVVSRTGDGSWTPVSDAREMVRLIHGSAELDSETQMGLWSDKARGFFRHTDQKIQNDEVTDMFEQHAWNDSIHSFQNSRSETKIWESTPRPAEAVLTADGGPIMRLDVPLYEV